MNGALLDTSFLITLTLSERPNHAAANKYYFELIRRTVPMYLSAIVVSEFEVKQQVADLGLNNFIVVPFNIDHARVAAALVMHGLSIRSADQSRVAVKDDVKLLAQCALSGISHFLTDDDICGAWTDRMRQDLPARNLPFAVCLSAGYSDSWFEPGNQGVITFG